MAKHHSPLDKSRRRSFFLRRLFMKEGSSDGGQCSWDRPIPQDNIIVLLSQMCMIRWVEERGGIVIIPSHVNAKSPRNTDLYCIKKVFLKSEQ